MSNDIVCFVKECTTTFELVERYISHLNEFHNIPNNHRCICTVDKCEQIFQKYYSFKRHLLNHKRIQSGTCRENVQEIPSPTSAEDIGNHNSEQNETNHTDSLIIETLAKIDRLVVEYSLNLHKRPNLTRNDVFEIQQGTKNVYTEIAKQIENLGLLSPIPDVNYQFHHYLQKLKHTFDGIDTEFKLFNYLEKLNVFKKPQIITVEKETNTLSIVNEESSIKSSLVLMPIAFQIKTFFELDNVLDVTLKNIDELEKSNRIHNFINGKAWKDVRKKYGTDLLIPISFYADEFEVNDPLSSHNKRHSVCGLYYSFPVIPKEFSSRLRNIFIAGMIRKIDINEVGINKLMQQLIDIFKEMEEEGILINYNGTQTIIRFVFSLFLGDNLGVHSFLLFSGSFSATFYCRFCKRPKSELQKDDCLHTDYLRNEENYRVDAQLQNQALTGIKGLSIFNQLPSFSVVKNISVDPMHDLFSTGVCKHGLTEVLNYCIFEKKFASLSEVNTRRRLISLTARDETLSRMPDLEETYLKTKKSKSITIRTTASEMKSFCFFISFILGPFFPKDDPVWEFCKTLVKLVDFALLTSFGEVDIEQFRQTITKHQQL